MILALLLQLHGTLYIFGVPQGTKLVAHEITTHAPRQAMVYTVHQHLLSANIKLILANLVREKELYNSNIELTTI